MAKLLELIPALQEGKSVSCTTASMTQITIWLSDGHYVLHHYLLEGEWAPEKRFSLDELKAYAEKGTSTSWYVDEASR